MTDSGPTATHRTRESLTIKAHGKDDATLLANALRQIFQHTDGMPAQAEPGDGEIIGFRATGETVDALLAATIHAALDEAEAQRVTVLAVDIAGVMPIDEGIRCWGYLSTTARREPRPAATLASEPTVTRERDQLRVEFVLQIA